MNRFLQLSLGFLASLSGGWVQAQHVHHVPHTTTHMDTVRHGNHYHHVPHTTTHYHNVIHYGPDYLPQSSSYYPSVYYNGNAMAGVPFDSTSQSFATQPIIASPSSVSSPMIATQASPSMATSSLSTAISLKPNSLPYTGRGVKIVFPPSLPGELTYVLDGVQEVVIQSGQEQVLNKKGTYEIKFSRGVNDQGRDFGMGRYTITEGTYRFAVTDKGWELYREPDTQPEAKQPDSEAKQLEVKIKKNSLPNAISSAN